MLCLGPLGIGKSGEESPSSKRYGQPCDVFIKLGALQRNKSETISRKWENPQEGVALRGPVIHVGFEVTHPSDDRIDLSLMEDRTRQPYGLASSQHQARWDNIGVL